MTQHNLETLELDDLGFHVRLIRRKVAPPEPTAVPVPLPAAGIISPSSAQPQTYAPPLQNPPPEALPPGALTVKANMMGIFYRAPSPSSPPFVKEGDKIQAGHVLCMIEAMKVFNEIKAAFPCTMIKTLLENGKPVKAGQDLFLVVRT
jgi:acetyl-CoA carboxylase biotin carboxyl carrier protein